MGLTKYRQKRDFSKSPEPKGGVSDKKELHFVIQKHDASRLHYDFRLEVRGVLKSWAVPKGPSTDVRVKRLAMMVEDHPFDYRNFEGIIPSGYGAGTVMVWDEGTYEPAGGAADNMKEGEKEILKGLHKGKIKFTLHGKKLKGEWALVKASGRGENAWLLMKLRDTFSGSGNVLKKNRSVVSGKVLEEIADKPSGIWQSHKNGKQRKHEMNGNGTVQTLLKNSPKKRFDPQLKPMLATLVDAPFDEPGWDYEVKWDGYRALAFVNKGKANLLSRNQKSFNDKFYPLIPALKKLKADAILDGEVVVVNSEGISDFSALQNWRSEADGDLLFYVFDLLWVNGKDLTGLPLRERRQVLMSIFGEHELLRVSENFTTSATQFLEVARQMGLEGIIAKRADSLYYPGTRSKDWLKIKAGKRQEVLIGGYTKNKGSSRLFSSLLVGVMEQGRLLYTGKVGTGFSNDKQKEILTKSKKLKRKTSPFSTTPDVNKPSRFRPEPPNAEATWLKPELVCEVNYAELTRDGVMRHPSFIALRTDKTAAEVKLEKPLPVQKVVSHPVADKLKRRRKNRERKTLLNPKEKTQVKKLNGHEVKFTNLSKIFWPEEQYTKRDLINYYYQIAPYMLPYLKDRPQSLNRHPNGYKGKSFYQKDVTGKVPGWIKTQPYKSEGDDRDKNFLVATNEASLLYMVSLGCIEINPWSSRVNKPDHPDWCIIDLDPGKGTFDEVIEAAQVTKQVLDSVGAEACCKTSGSTGLHIYIPLGAKYTYEQSKEFARVIATMVHNELPSTTSIERTVKNRRGKLYIDFLQNRPQATIAAPYSVRPKPGATVSMPLYWEEVKKGLQMRDFTIANASARLRETGDIFARVSGKGINLHKIAKQF